MNTLTVPFHGESLFIVERDNQPYTPMKPIVEGMGLDWKSQHRKLSANKARWGMVKMTIPTTGDLQDMICMPLRKLFGWLCTISPNKVRPELKDSIICYQNECDDVLWDHWTRESSKGISVQQPAVLCELQDLITELANLRASRLDSEPDIATSTKIVCNATDLTTLSDEERRWAVSVAKGRIEMEQSLNDKQVKAIKAFANEYGFILVERCLLMDLDARVKYLDRLPITARQISEFLPKALRARH